MEEMNIAQKRLVAAIVAIHPELYLGDKKQEELYLAMHDLTSKMAKLSKCGGECSNENSDLNIPVVIARFLKEQATEYKTEQQNIVVGLMQNDLYVWDFDGGRAMQNQWQTKKVIDEPLNWL